MLMPKDPVSQWCSTDFTTGAPYVLMKDTPFVHLMIPLWLLRLLHLNKKKKRSEAALVN